jgi:hypothetical protein
MFMACFMGSDQKLWDFVGLSLNYILQNVSI